MQLPSHTNALADHKNATGAAKHFAEAEEAARLTQLKEERRAHASNQQLTEAFDGWTPADSLALFQARRKRDPLLVARVFNAALDRELDKIVDLEVAEEAAGICTGFVNQVRIDPSIGCAYGTGEEVKANAHLIAGAPKMYDALREIVISLCALVENPANPDFMLALGSSNPADNDELKSALEAARAAIAKAEGQS